MVEGGEEGKGAIAGFCTDSDLCRANQDHFHFNLKQLEQSKQGLALLHLELRNSHNLNNTNIYLQKYHLL